jgi:hypothetical protein
MEKKQSVIAILFLQISAIFVQHLAELEHVRGIAKRGKSITVSHTIALMQMAIGLHVAVKMDIL